MVIAKRSNELELCMTIIHLLVVHTHNKDTPEMVYDIHANGSLQVIDLIAMQSDELRQVMLLPWTTNSV